ncbi:MAG: DNA topoisomerase 4 subunit A [Erysipelotrichaceae bacterium]|nr:DNA topoisomerase 4 subunit A [Erysipelotrichaceae bacterium]
MPRKRTKGHTQEALEFLEEKIIDVEYSDVMRKSYIDYSMSVITSRALPDVRDGLKPVQRRILYDMAELGVTSDKPYRKVARIVGDTMGKYHPHGDSSIGEAIVVMAQDWKKMAPMVDGHGNFGSIEGDEAAASRYIECRMTDYSENVLLADLRENTVDFMPNYDEQEKEPVILPCKLPNLLINGSEGIAVGMATNIPTHNVGETIDAAIYYLDHPDATSEELMQFIPGPDFPTGGIIANKDALKTIYETGTGKIRVRGKVSIESEKGKDRIVVSEIPYTMIGDGIGKFLQSVADLVENKTLADITDISNQSSKEGIRIVFDLKKGADAQNIINILYKKTKLEDTYGYNLLAISNGRPETMSLAAVYADYADFQYEIYSRKFQNLLRKAARRKEIDEGLITAIDVIDAVVEVIRGSKTVAQARTCLMTGDTSGIIFKTGKSMKQAQKFCFTELQTDAIMELRLQRLVGLELDVLTEDYRKITRNMARYEKLLDSNAEMTKEIKKGLLELKEKYNRPRRTEIIEAGEIVIEEKPEEILPVVVLADRFHYIRAIDPSVYEKNRETIDAENKYIILASTDQKLILFTDKGKAYTLKVKDIPYGRLRDKGVPVDNITSYDSKVENIVSILLLMPLEEWIFVSSDGYVKRVDSGEFDVTRKAVDATKLAQDQTLVAVTPFTGENIALESEKGYSICFKQEEIPHQGKTARGAIGMHLSQGDRIRLIDMASLIRASKRGGKGKKR